MERQPKQLYLVMGKPYSGKTTAGSSAAEQLNASFFSIGQAMRDVGLGDTPSRVKAEVQEYAEALRRHEKIPSHFAHTIFEERVNDSPSRCIVVDGYPQFPDRLPKFSETLAKVGGTVLAVCEIVISDEEVYRRAANRPHRSEQVPEDEAFVARRLEGYYANMASTVQALQEEYGYALHRVDGMQDKGAVAANLAALITDIDSPA